MGGGELHESSEAFDNWFENIHSKFVEEGATHDQTDQVSAEAKQRKSQLPLLKAANLGSESMYQGIQAVGSGGTVGT